MDDLGAVVARWLGPLGTPGALAVLAASSLVLFVVSAAGLPVLLCRLPADYFVRQRRSGRRRTLLFLVGRNCLALVLAVLGLAMLVLPGQGLLTLLAAFVVSTVPGKRRLQLALLRRPAVRRAVDALRRRAGAPPLVLDRPDAAGDGR